MKIGILTLHRAANFGANLQAYATTLYLRSLGHEVRVIDYVRKKDVHYGTYVDKVQLEAHRQFVETCLPLTRMVTDAEGLQEVVTGEGLQQILVGADAVWNVPHDDNVYFADWAFSLPQTHSVRVSSLAPAHMGKGFMQLSTETRNNIKKSLTRFSYLSVRDEWTRNVINRDIFCGEEKVKSLCPDPVFTLAENIDTSQWRPGGMQRKQYYLMTLPKNWGEGRLFGKRRIKWFARFKSLVNAKGYKLVELPLPEGKSGMPFDYSLDYPISPIQWFLWIMNAKAFCGLRFHAVVASVSCGTPFYSVDSYGCNTLSNILLDVLGFHSLARRRDRGSKIYNLLAGSPFSKSRTGQYLEWESPHEVFRKLEYADTDLLKEWKTKMTDDFACNVARMLEK